MHTKKMAGAAGDISLPDVSKLNDLKDDQIEALIEKLAEVQAHAPQIIAALEAQQESRSRGSKSKGSKGDRDRKGSSDRGERTQPPKQQQQRHQSPGPQQHYVEENFDEEEEEDEDDEDYDDFDEDAEYPMVGEGYSDELSVVSDMTTPTVVSSLEIPDEEYYRDMAGIKVKAPKKKDLLSQVAKTNARKAPGAAMKKKAALISASDTALKKPSRVASMHSARPDGKPPSGTKEVKKKKVKDRDGNGTATPTGTKKVKKKVAKKKGTSLNNSGTGWDATNGGGGPSSGSGSKKKGPQEKAAPVMIDDDGFLVDQSAFETFDSSNNPFARAPSFTAGQASAEDSFGAFATFGNEPAPKKVSKSKKLNVSSTGKKKGSGSASTSGSSPKTKRKGARRQSLGM